MNLEDAGNYTQSIIMAMRVDKTTVIKTQVADFM